LISFIFIFKINFFNKLYVLILKNYNQRITDSYGFCSISSIGFINYLNKKYQFKDPPQIVNYAGSAQYWIFFKNIKKFNNEFIILLNEQKIYKKNYKKEISLNDYFIIEKFDDCYLLKKK
jgi:hypothetical protein